MATIRAEEAAAEKDSVTMSASTPAWMRPDPEQTGVDLRTDVPHSARIYDYILGGKDNFPPDRAAGDLSLAGWPGVRTSMQQNRYFMNRAVRYLAEKAGIRQFLDVGTGIPTAPNLHDVVQAVAPESRVVYVDNDPIVLAHARALLTSSAEGRTVYVDADLTDPESILSSPEFTDTLDLTQPVALSVIAVVQFIPDEVAYAVVRRLMDRLPSGSFLALSTATGDIGEGIHRAAAAYREQGIFVALRDKGAVEKFFEGYELVDPGVTLTNEWHPDEKALGVPHGDSAMYAGVARKP
nr:SAM-dependent methyltransferase [Cryptosporangium arvum]